MPDEHKHNMRHGRPRAVAHVDMDAFYVAVEVNDDPRLKGRPVIVGGSPDGSRGVVCSASYEARKFGVKSAMPAGMAKRLCPDAVFLPGRMDRYESVSKLVFTIMGRFTPLVQPVSVDEAFLDMTDHRGFERSVVTALELKSAIAGETGCTCSVGLASNKSVAKIASDLRKPDGFVVVPPGTEQEFLDPLPASKIWGVGPKTTASLEEIGISTIRELRERNVRELEARFGMWGRSMYDLARGIDFREVEAGHSGQRGSISAQSTFGKDLRAWPDLEEALLGLSERVAARAREKGLAGRTVTLTARYPDFRTVTRSVTLPAATRSTDDLYDWSRKLLTALRRAGDSFRLLGVGISNLTTKVIVQKDLFEPEVPHAGRKIDEVMDQVAARKGRGVVVRARLLGRKGRRTKEAADVERAMPREGNGEEERGALRSEEGRGKREEGSEKSQSCPFRQTSGVYQPDTRLDSEAKSENLFFRH